MIVGMLVIMSRRLKEFRACKLTDAWLIRLGFRVIGESAMFIAWGLPNYPTLVINYCKQIENAESNPYGFESGKHYVGSEEAYILIEDVHTIQNLFYILHNKTEII
jgi:hypothetical protein